MFKMFNSYILRVLLACLIVGLVFQSRATRGSKSQPDARAKAVSSRPASQPASRPIESIEVGQRVLANNPELSVEQHASIVEPDWHSWLRVSLELPLVDSAESMQIELLRPEQWVRQRIEYSAAPVAEEEIEDEEPELAGRALCLRGLFEDEQTLSDFLQPCGMQIVARQLRLDLSDMGAVGLATVKRITPCPEIASGSGCVVTGTFSNRALEQVLDVTLGNDQQRCTIGVTCTHPFWSIDQQEFVPIDQLPVGARLLDASGNETTITSKLPRPGPPAEQVFNLEVFGQHVYCVGPVGVVVHNRCATGDLGEHGAKGWLERHGYTDIHSFQNPSGHGIDLFARHRDGTLTFFEVKTSSGARAPGLSGAQKSPFSFITSRLKRAWDAGPWWSKTPQAVRDKAQDLFNDLKSGAKYRRYVIEITSAGNSSAPTTFRILPWP